MNIIESLGEIIASLGFTVMFGWFKGIGLITKLHPDWVAMQFSTALCFAATGLIIILSHRAITTKSNFAGAFVSFLSYLILFVVMTHGLTYLSGESAFIEKIFLEPNPIKTFIPGLPAITTIINFHLVALWTKCFIFRVTEVGKFIIMPMIAISISAIIGYILDIPVLYGYVEDKFTGMALHTALGFCLVSFALWQINKIVEPHRWSLPKLTIP